MTYNTHSKIPIRNAEMALPWHALELPLELLDKSLKQDIFCQQCGILGLYYLKGLKFYLAGETEELRFLIERIKITIFSQQVKKVYGQWILLLLQLRLAIREVHSNEIAELISKLEIQKYDLAELWLAESAFVMARGSEIIFQAEKAQKFYEFASLKFAKNGLSRKSLKSKFNALTSREKWQKTIDFLEYTDVLNQAIRLRDWSIAGIVCNNLGFELLLRGAYLSADRMLLRSRNFLKKEKEGFNYQLALLNHAHLHLLMGHPLENYILDLEKSIFPQIQSAAVLLKSHHQIIETPLDTKFTPGWTWRIKFGLASLEELSVLEDSLLGFMIVKPRTRAEIVKFLWSDFSAQENSSIADNRLKRVLARLRKKRPNIIEFKNIFSKDTNELGSYYLLNTHINAQAILLRKTNILIKSVDTIENKKVRLLPNLEQKLWDVLQTGPLSFHQIVDSVYGPWMNKNEDYQNYMNRLKQLISRLRKKNPGSLLCRDGQYYLSESGSQNLLKPKKTRKI